MSGPRIFVKLADLTPQIYMRYKRTEMTDTEIARLYDVSLETITNWKKANGLSGKINVRSWETWDKYFPDEVRKIKKRFLELYNQGWKHIYIAEELGMTRNQLTRFKDRYFPDMMSRVTLRFTDEQKRIAKEHGIKLDTARHRIHNGMDVEEAIRKPIESEGWRGDPDKRMIGNKTAKEVTDEPLVRIKDHLTEEEIQKAYDKGLSRNVLYRRIRAGWSKQAIINTPSRKKRKGKSK